MGDWILYVGLPIHVYLLTGSALATSAMFAASTLPRLIFGSFAGVLVDRWDRRRTLIVGNVLQGIALLPLLAVHSADDVWYVYAVAAFESVLAQFVDPAEGAFLPRLVKPDQLVAANVMNALNNNLARLIGPAVGGLIAATFGLMGVALADAVSFFGAAALVTLIRTSGAAEDHPTTGPASAWQRLWREWAAGLRLVLSSRPLVVVFVLVAISALGEGVFSVLYVLFVYRVLGGGATEIGALMSAQAIGGLIGAFAVVPVGHLVSPARLLGLAAVVFGVIDFLIFNAPAFGSTIVVMTALFVLVGVPVAVLFPSVNAIIQSTVADAYRGRVLGALGTTMALLGLAGIGIAGTLGDVVGVVPILNIQAFAHVVAGLVVLAILPAALRARGG